LATSAPSAKVDEETVQVGADYAARLGALEHLHLPGLTDLVRLIFNAGKLQRYPVIMIVRGGGLGDTLQATFVAESLRQWYHDAFIIMVLRNDWTHASERLSLHRPQRSPQVVCLYVHGKR
jgi:hypothetical protein